MRQIPRLPNPTIPQEQRTKPLDDETKTILENIRFVLDLSETQSPWARVDVRDPGSDC